MPKLAEAQFERMRINHYTPRVHWALVQAPSVDCRKVQEFAEAPDFDWPAHSSRGDPNEWV